MADEEIDVIINKAIKIWLNALGDQVKITKLTENDEKFDKSNITIYFAEGYHGDSMLFDGIDGELAHSCPLSNTKSPFKGHIHLDDAENWDRDGRLLSVMLHQIGHLLGLDHSGNPKSIMSPVFNFNTEELLEEDVRNVKLVLGIERLYSSNLTELKQKANLKNIVKIDTTSSSPVSVEEVKEIEPIDTKEANVKAKFEFSPVVEITSTNLEEFTTRLLQENELQTTTTENFEDTTPKMFSNDNLPIVEFVPEEKKEQEDEIIAPESTTTKIFTNHVDSNKMMDHLILLQNESIVSNTTSIPFTSTQNYTIIEVKNVTYNELELPKEVNQTEEIVAEETTTAILSSEVPSTTSTATSTVDSTESTTIDQEIKNPEEEEFLNLLLRMNLSRSDLTTEYIPPKTTTTELPLVNSTQSVLNETFNNEMMPKALNSTDDVIVLEEAKEISTTTILATTAEDLKTQNIKVLTTTGLSKPFDLCESPEIDEITRTEWGNAFVFKGDFVYHIRGLTKWRLFDYDGWPKRITDLFPNLPGHIDAAYFFDDHYYFTKNNMLWKYRIANSYPPKYVLDRGFPKLLKEEYPQLPFKTLDAAFAVATSIFFFKGHEFWQSDWSSNVTSKVPIKVDAAVSWRNPRLEAGPNEPLAYIISNSSMYKFNYWSFPLSQESLDIRYFLFDCVQTNYQPDKDVFLGPSYRQAFIADDIVHSKESVEKREDKSVLKPYVARLVNEANLTVFNNDEPKVTQIKNSSSKLSILLSTMFITIFGVAGLL